MRSEVGFDSWNTLCGMQFHRESSFFFIGARKQSSVHDASSFRNAGVIRT